MPSNAAVTIPKNKGNPSIRKYTVFFSISKSGTRQEMLKVDTIVIFYIHTDIG